MYTRTSRLTSLLVALAATVLGSSAAQATGFTVHGYQLGERIALTNGTRVHTAQFDVSVENLARHVPSYCVDLYTQIGVGQYDARGVLDADTAVAPAGEQARNFAWAGHVMENFGANVNSLVTTGITRVQAITGVQAAIWQGIYGGNTILRSSLSAGARTIYDRIMRSQFSGDSDSLVVELRGRQDQVIHHPVPEPSAALVFGFGTLVAGSLLRRRAS